jgi:hypothetical protein
MQFHTIPKDSEGSHSEIQSRLHQAAVGAGTLLDAVGICWLRFCLLEKAGFMM